MPEPHPRHPLSLLVLFALLLSLLWTAPLSAQESNAQQTAANTDETSSPSATSTLFEPLHQHIEEVLGDSLATDRAGLLLIHGGEVVYERYFGNYHASSVVPLGSASQWLSAALILTLVDSGHLELDATLADIIDTLPDGTQAPQLPNDKSGITLRQLLNHTSGLPSQHACLAERNVPLASCAALILQQPLKARPGREFRYGAASYQVAAYLAELTTGQTWHALLRQRLGDPLGLGHTDFGSGTNPNVASGARSNAGDYASFLEMLLQRGLSQGQRLLSEALITELLSDQVGNAEIVYSPYEDRRYTLGAWRRNDRLSCPGTFGFTPWIDLDPGLIGVLQVVARPDAAGPLAERIQTEARAALEPGE